MIESAQMKWGSGFLVDLAGPVDQSNGLALDTSGAGATAVFALFNHAKTSWVTQDTVLASVVLEDASRFAVGDKLELERNDGTVVTSITVSSVDAESGLLTLSGPPGGTVPKGSRVSAWLGDAYQSTMSEYGTPVAGRTDYGFRGGWTGTQSRDHLLRGMRVRLEPILRLGGADLHRVEMLSWVG